MKTEQGNPIQFRARHLRTADGTRLRYFDSEGVGPAIILANGLGGPASAWNPYLELWRDQFRLLTWDYRGLYGSSIPSNAVSLNVSTHAQDLHAIVEDADVDQAVFFGWSMGVQVGLEAFSQRPEAFSKLIFINGTYGRPLHGLPLPFSGLTLPPLVRGARRFHGFGRHLLSRISRSKFSYDLLRRLYLIAPGFSRRTFEEMTQAFESVDLDVYLALLTRLHEHDAQHHLPTLDVPTLVIAGARDVLTPPWFARKMAEAIPHSELFVVPGGTHYCAAEYPEVIAKRVEEFITKPPPRAASRANGPKSPSPTRASS